MLGRWLIAFCAITCVAGCGGLLCQLFSSLLLLPLLAFVPLFLLKGYTIVALFLFTR